MNAFRKILISAAFLAYTEFFGLINFDEEFRIPGGLKIHDIINILVLGHLAFLLANSRVMFKQQLWHKKTFFLVTAYLALVLGVAFSMKFRAPVSLVDTFKIARNFFPLFLFYYVWYDIVVSGSVKFYESFLRILAIGFSLLFITSTIAPAFIASNFHGLHIKMQTTSGFKMPRTYGYGFVFPYLYFIFQYVRFFLTKEMNPLVFFVNFVGVAVQGFRSYFFALIIIIILINLVFTNRKRFMNSLASLAIIGAVFILFATIAGNGFLEDKVLSVFSDVSSDEGSFAGREQSDEIFRLPLLFQNPVFGIGFIHGESDYAQRLGSVYKDRDYMLYSTDSGLITMSLMFGIAGSFLIFLLVLRYLLQVFREIKKSASPTQHQYGITVCCYLMMLLITIKTHGGLIYIYGLTPMVFILAMYAGKSSGIQLLKKAQTPFTPTLKPIVP